MIGKVFTLVFETMSQVQHIVLFKFKPQITSATVKDIFKELAQLQQLIPGITHFAGGSYSSNEGLNQGYTHGFLMTFESVEARNHYLPHPEHERVKQEILPLIEDLIAFDFEG